MEKCTLRYYIETESNRILRFEKPVNFQAVPPVGAYLNIRGDSLIAEHLEFIENGGVVIWCKSIKNVPDRFIKDTIEELRDNSWALISDCQGASWESKQ